METERKLKIGVVGRRRIHGRRTSEDNHGAPESKSGLCIFHLQRKGNPSTAYTTTFLASPTCAFPGK